MDLTKYTSACSYIENYWTKITFKNASDEGTLIGLPHPYIVPNHDMFRELYYWDSYFISLGLHETAFEELVPSILRNLLYLLKRFERIPNSSRYYHLSRSQPPFLTSFILDAYMVVTKKSHDEGTKFLEEAYELTQLEYTKVWRGKQFPDEREVYKGLSRYYDINIWHNAAEAESGWDMTPRFDNRCLDIIPIDLNCLLFKYESDLGRMAEILGKKEEVKRWTMLLEERRRMVSDLLWDPSTSYFYDFDYRHEKRLTFRSIAGFFPLWCGLATAEQASLMVKNQLPFFETPFGVVTTEEWNPEPGEVAKQWAWPNGWAPLIWITIQGLVRYGYSNEAKRIALKWVNLVNDIFLSTNNIYEKYDVVRGCRARSDRYPDQHGFGWTNSIFLRCLRLLSEK